MSQSPKRCWWPRFSLKTFLLAWLLGSVGVAWIAQTCSEYLVEQRLIESLAEKVSPGRLITVVAKGDNTFPFGFVLM